VNDIVKGGDIRMMQTGQNPHLTFETLDLGLGGQFRVQDFHRLNSLGD
jgi:hypothetical protein